MTSLSEANSRVLSSIKLIVVTTLVVMLVGCGTLTGIPSHGGGKRFAVEQRLVSTTIRGAIKEIDLTELRGKTVFLQITSINDQGAGNMIGGRASMIFAMQGITESSPISSIKNSFKVFDLSSSGGTTTTQNVTGGSNTGSSNFNDVTSSSSSSVTTSGTINGTNTSTTNGTSTGTNNNTANGTNNSTTNGSSTGTANSTGSSTSNGSNTSTNTTNGSNTGTSNTNINSTTNGSGTNNNTTNVNSTTTNNGTGTSASNGTNNTTTTTGATTTTQNGTNTNNTNTTNNNTSNTTGTNTSTGANTNTSTTTGTNAGTTSGTNTSTSNGSGTNTNTTNSTGTNNTTGTNTGTTTGTNTNTTNGTSTGTNTDATNGSSSQDTTSTAVTGATTSQSNRGGSSSNTSNFQNATTSSSNNGTNQVLANQAEETRNQTKGTGYKGTYGVDYRGQGSYSNFNVPVSDVGILQSIVRTYFYLNDVQVTTDPNNPAIEAIVNINVDVFGSIRSRLDTVVYNKESVKVQTVLEVMAINYRDQTLMMVPQTGSYEAVYDEKYAFWIGPLNRKDKRIKHNSMADPMLVSFADVAAAKAERDRMAIQQRASVQRATSQLSPISQQQPVKPTALDPIAEETRAVASTLATWLRAWGNSDVAGYLNSYSPAFVPNDGMSVTRWKRERTNKLTNSSNIRVTLKNAQIQVAQNQSDAEVTFTQEYSSSSYQDTTMKQLELQKVGGQWKITREYAIEAQ